MKARLIVFPLLLLLAACGGSNEPEVAPTEPAPEPTAEPQPPANNGGTTASDVAGQWEGAITIDGTELGIIVDFLVQGDALTATIDIPQQNAADLPLGGVALDGNNIRFAIEQVGAQFDGIVDGETMSGDFTQGPAVGTFSLSRTGEVLVPTATPVPPYGVEELSWQLDDTTMTGTLTLPEGEGPFPAVLFIAGSGTTDRNWNSPLLPGTNGSAALLADALTRAGYATLRFDKRATGPNAMENLTALQGKVSMQSHLDEVTSALAQLTARPEVDPATVFALGNSEGTLHALNAQVSGDPKPFAGLVLAAPPGRPLIDVLRQQIENKVLADNPDSERLLAEFNDALEAFIDGEASQPGADWPDSLSATLAGLTAPINLPFSREFLVVDSAEWLPQVAVPVLVLIGQKDIQVDWQADGPALEAVAEDNVTFVYPENANHVLKYEPKPASELTAADAAAYNAADRVLDPDSLQTILDWLAANGGQ